MMTTNLLAGPILRRTTKNRICVWLATSNPMPLRLTIIDHQDTILGQSDFKDLNQHRLQLGKNLWIYLLQAKPNQDTTFPFDELMCYRLDVVDLENQDLIIPLNLTDLGYGSLKYPSFFLPTKLNQLLHGSCRKPHGGFNSTKQKHMPDALSHGHDLMEKTHSNLELRPAILLLTGDQIYADDTSISLLAMLRKQSIAIIGKQEILPLVDRFNKSNLTLTNHLDPISIPLHGRKHELHKKYKTSETVLTGKDSGFSSNESENHLFTFGEFATMYIYAFGNLPNWEPIWDWQELVNLGVTNPEDAKEAWATQDAPLQSFHKTLPQIRKLLANISTYMILDDHDVTDDWNITGAWYEGVRDSPLGRRIVSNALAAYWAFQGWGNDPDNFDKDLILTITQQLNDNENDADISERFDLHTWKSRGWGFSIPTEPPIIAIDSRTQRQYENKFYPSQLLDRYALDWLRVEWAKLKTGQYIDGNTCPLMITTTPVMGFSTIEVFQQLTLWLAGQVENLQAMRYLEKLADKEGFLTGWLVNLLDVESWSANKKGFVNFLDTLSRRMEVNRCIFLSGDVHYAFTANASFNYQSRKLQCYQLTSSALCNVPDTKQSKFLHEADSHDKGIKTLRNWALLSSQIWTAKVQLLEVENGKERITDECNLGLVEFRNGLPVSHTLLTSVGRIVYRLS